MMFFYKMLYNRMDAGFVLHPYINHTVYSDYHRNAGYSCFPDSVNQRFPYFHVVDCFQIGNHTVVFCKIRQIINIIFSIFIFEPGSIIPPVTCKNVDICPFRQCTVQYAVNHPLLRIKPYTAH